MIKTEGIGIEPPQSGRDTSYRTILEGIRAIAEFRKWLNGYDNIV